MDSNQIGMGGLFWPFPNHSSVSGFKSFKMPRFSNEARKGKHSIPAGASASQNDVFFPVFETVWRTSSGFTLPFTVTFCSFISMSNDSTPEHSLARYSLERPFRPMPLAHYQRHLFGRARSLCIIFLVH
nr:Protein kinase G11A [Ipomoea batatas]